MTLVEFLHPIRKGQQRYLVLAVLFYYQHFKDVQGMTAAEIRSALTQAKIPNAKNINVNQVINTSAPYIHSPRGKENGAFIFVLTPSGEKHIRDVMDVPALEPEVQHDVASLRKLSESISDEMVRGFIDEATLCLSASALRAAIVFLWSGAIRTLHEDALNRGEAALNAALKKQDPKAREVTKTDHFAWIKDRTFLDASPDIGLLDKGQKDTLIEALNLRNRCGHPTKFRPGVQKTRGFIEDIVGIVFK